MGAELTFGETAVSRKIICFQVRFLRVSSEVDLGSFVDLAVPDKWLKALKEIHSAIGEHRGWVDYFAFLGMPPVSPQERVQQLEAAVEESRKLGYHGGKKNGPRRR